MISVCAERRTVILCNNIIVIMFNNSFFKTQSSECFRCINKSYGNNRKVCEFIAFKDVYIVCSK